jgi:putative transposase
MTNHVHLVATPAREKSLAGALKPVHARYAQHVNWTHQLTGRLWQGRFFSCALDDAYTWAAIRYVERNPVRAGLVDRAETYAWSSAGAHCGLRRDPLVAPLPEPTAAISDWSAWLDEPDEDRMAASLRMHTRTGRPLGSTTFLNALETLLDRTVRPRKGGRSRKRAGKVYKHR